MNKEPTNGPRVWYDTHRRQADAPTAADLEEMLGHHEPLNDDDKTALRAMQAEVVALRTGAALADVQAIRHTLMTGLSHNDAIAALDRIAAPGDGQGASVELRGFLDHWAADASAEYKAFAKEGAAQALAAGHETPQLKCAWAAWQARAAIAAREQSPDDELLVACITLNGATLTVEPHQMEDVFGTDDEQHTYELTFKRMTRAAYEALGEFNGF